MPAVTPGRDDLTQSGVVGVPRFYAVDAGKPIDNPLDAGEPVFSIVFGPGDVVAGGGDDAPGCGIAHGVTRNHGQSARGGVKSRPIQTVARAVIRVARVGLV